MSRRVFAPEELEPLRSEMVHLAQAVSELDVREFEDARGDALVTLRSRTLELVERACVLVTGTVEVCMKFSDASEKRPSSLPFGLALDAAVAQPPIQQAIEDVAFLVMLELRQRRERLQQLGGDPIAVLSECDGALRRIRKGLGAIEVVAAKVFHQPVRLDFSTELQRSLLVRAAYAKFSRRLRANAPAGETPTDLRTALRRVGTEIAVLVGRDAFPMIRVRDRLQIRSLQRRILDWLHVLDPVEGARLWQDIVGFVEMLGHVNRREELISHDREVVKTALGVGPGDAPTLKLVCAKLVGRDPGLDAWLSTPSTPEDAHRILSRIAVELGGLH